MNTTETAERVVDRMTAIIREDLRAARITTTELSRRTGIVLPTLTRRLNGHGRPWLIPELAEVAKVLGYSLTELVERAEG